MRTLLLVVLSAVVQGSHEPKPEGLPLPTLGERALDVHVSERWQLRFADATVSMSFDKSTGGAASGLPESRFTLEKSAHFSVQDSAISESRARTITRSYSEVSSKVDLECTDAICGLGTGRGAVRGQSDCSWTTLRYVWDPHHGEYDVRRVSGAESAPLPDPVPGADEGLHTFASVPPSAQQGGTVDMQQLVRHWTASDPPITRMIVDADPWAPQQLELVLSAVIDAIPRLEGLEGELTEVVRLRTETAREYGLLLRTGTHVDVSQPVVERLRGHPSLAGQTWFEIDTAHIDARIRGTLRMGNRVMERIPASIRMEGAVTLELDLSGPCPMGGRSQLHCSLEGSLEREFRADVD